MPFTVTHREITASEITRCGLPACGKPFVARYASDRYCSEHSGRGKQLARDTRRARSHEKTCIHCEEPFTAKDVRREVCDACMAMLVILDDGRVVRATMQASGEFTTPTSAQFVGVDGEGIQGKCKRQTCDCELYAPVNPEDDESVCECGHSKYVSHEHIYVLLGCGDIQRDWPTGVRDVTEVFSFLYEQFQANPSATFVGFYLGYDFNMWLRLLPRNRAAMLYTAKGINSRKRRRSRAAPFPVEYKGWQFDMLGNSKRFKLRPKLCDCPHQSCKCKAAPWMYICDAGPFFQTSLMNAINPEDWSVPVVSKDEYEILMRGKKSRSSAELNDEMRMYNRLENNVLARLLDRLNKGFVKSEVVLKRDKWFGPGQAAQAWMYKLGALREVTEYIRTLDRPDFWQYNDATRAEYSEDGNAWETFTHAEVNHQTRVLGRDFKYARKIAIPKTMQDAFIASYYGGRFEIAIHGIVPGTSYEYDLNSAYPYVISRLPCICDKGKIVTGYGTPPNKVDHSWLLDRDKGNERPQTELRLCHVKVSGSDPYLAALPYRMPNGFIVYPRYTFGWYWQHEIDAGIDAGLIDTVEYLEWIEFQPCGHRNPVEPITGLYLGRLAVGKDTPEGKAFKLEYNSVYGKFVQSEGEPVFGNPIYGSLVTSGCRTLILNAIASHPLKSRAVSMVATDGIYFLTPHDAIEHDESKLGWWGEKGKENMTLFKPGLYWDDKARDAVRAGKAAKFKSRGISAAAFSTRILDVDEQFKRWNVAGTFYEPVGEDSIVPPKFSEIGKEQNLWPRVQFRSGFVQLSLKQALAWTEGNQAENSRKFPAGGNPSALAQVRADSKARREAKYYALAGKVLSGKQLWQDANPRVKRNPYLYWDDEFKVWRSKPWGNMGKTIESLPYEKRFGLDDENPWNGYDTPDGDPIMLMRIALGVGGR